eukprot:gb/GEZN01013555.1/.p1 GENE.gb/GEZN01013555.1/~~gb/GEZN01013555.1/.p1  ORF type:complete len:270 (+),score=33.42 gb/GEZN01013555.1/:182-991(+)
MFGVHGTRMPRPFEELQKSLLMVDSEQLAELKARGQLQSAKKSAKKRQKETPGSQCRRDSRSARKVDFDQHDSDGDLKSSSKKGKPSLKPTGAIDRHQIEWASPLPTSTTSSAKSPKKKTSSKVSWGSSQKGESEPSHADLVEDIFARMRNVGPTPVGHRASMHVSPRMIPNSSASSVPFPFYSSTPTSRRFSSPSISTSALSHGESSSSSHIVASSLTGSPIKERAPTTPRQSTALSAASTPTKAPNPTSPRLSISYKTRSEWPVVWR